MGKWADLYTSYASTICSLCYFGSPSELCLPTIDHVSTKSEVLFVCVATITPNHHYQRGCKPCYDSLGPSHTVLSGAHTTLL